MEHFKSPFGATDFASARALENQRFFGEMLERARNHRFYSHPFMSTFESAPPSPELVSFVLTSFYKIVSPFTGLLCSLGGQAPNLRSRFALMDNIFEEMGCGDLSSAHPSLYLKMLASIGVSADAAERTPTLVAIQRINDHLREVVERRHFSVACAVLASAESTIPPSFPVLATMARSAFVSVDMAFFERHGPRDEGHSDDAALLFAVTADSSHYSTVEAEVKLDLDYRCELFDEWMLAMTKKAPQPQLRVSDRPLRRVSERPARPASVGPPGNHDSVPPPR
jgi:pyrroloquinoline quinone (PQQ) biosynthesis protein C